VSEFHITREYRHSVQKLWHALTDPELAPPRRLAQGRVLTAADRGMREAAQPGADQLRRRVHVSSDGLAERR
jgi:hypothetical protein